jgi:hypothetical protein
MFIKSFYEIIYIYQFVIFENVSQTNVPRRVGEGFDRGERRAHGGLLPRASRDCHGGDGPVAPSMTTPLYALGRFSRQ